MANSRPASLLRWAAGGHAESGQVGLGREGLLAGPPKEVQAQSESQQVCMFMLAGHIKEGHFG